MFSKAECMQGILRHANIQLAHNQWNGDATQTPGVSTSHAHDRTTKWWPWDDVEKVIDTVVNDVEDAAEAVAYVAQYVTTGALDLSKNWDYTPSWNYAGIEHNCVNFHKDANVLDRE